MTNITELEKEILTDVMVARAELRDRQEVFPSGLDKDALLANVTRHCKFAKYFTTIEDAEELAKKKKMLLNTANINITFEAALDSDAKTAQERIDSSFVTDEKLSIARHEIRQRLINKLDDYLGEYPSMKFATSLAIVGDELICKKDLMMDPLSFEAVVKYRFILKLKIFVV